MILLSTIVAQGQIKIGGNVYGGGNHAEVKGSTKVTVLAGDIGAVMDPNAERPLKDPQGKVFGGARMANVGGNTFVHIDGESGVAEGTPNYILINQVYGGNDIAGTIGTGTVPDKLSAVLPSTLPEGKTKEDYPEKNDVDNSFNSFVRISTKVKTGENSTYKQEEIDRDANNPEGEAYGKKVGAVKPDPDARKVYIGQLFAGGNGDFDYEQEPTDGGKIIHSIYNWSDTRHEYPIAQKTTVAGGVGFQLPELDKTYLEVVGGSIVYAYGGGNNATVRTQNIIHIDNPSAVVNHIKVDATGKEDANGTDLLVEARFKEMGINTTFSKPSSGAYQVGRFFGGNNKATMTIRPEWKLLSGKVRNMYSGGNRGDMTSPVGLLLEIPESSGLIVDNLYGGCRMADVHPKKDGVGADVKVTNDGFNDALGITDPDKKYKFPDYFSARVLVRGGHINNVYGGNDVTGTVYGGNAVGIYTTVYGDVYGGGNGDYPYTNMLKDDDSYGDFYYEGGDVEDLNAFRPNAERVSIRLKGKNGSPSGYTVIQGSVFLGGNCATLVSDESNRTVELKIGSYVIADNVFLGNNGEGMIYKDYLEKYADSNFNTLDLTDPSVFRGYMDGVAMPLKPSIMFDDTKNGDPASYEPFSSFVGSFYCGGNVGSMTIKGKETLTIDQGLNIYEKFVGGCNSADVKAIDGLCADYEGGILGAFGERGERGEPYYTDSGVESGNIKDRLEINLENLTITPLRWNDNKTQLMWNTQKWGYVYTALDAGVELEEGDVYYTSNPYTEHTVTESSHTVTKNDKFFKKLDNKYISYAIGTELPVDSKYYTLTGTKNTVTDAGHTAAAGEYLEEKDFVEVPRNPSDHQIRLLGGNVYGGCYESGHVNGNVVININQELLNKDKVFGTAENAIFRNPASGVEREDQRDDLMAVALSVFGAGYGEKTEVWGSTTVNHNNGYAFQIYGGGQSGVVGKKDRSGDYNFDERYGCTVNLKGNTTASSNEGAVANLAEAEYIYGGGNEGDVCGNTLVNLGNGRVYDAFGGASDADILGHTEVYIGRQPYGSSYIDAFPWVKDIVYGGNDFGGTIYGAYDEESSDFETSLKARLRDYETDKTQLHGYTDGKIPDVLKSSTYVEYLIGRVDTIFGGGYGSYDYTDTELYGNEAAMPKQHSSFVNIRPMSHNQNALKAVFGGGTGFPGNRDDDKAQDRSYVLIDIPDGETTFKDLEAFGAGSYNGLGMRYHLNTETGKTVDEKNNPISSLDEASAIVDLLHGQIHNAFGGSYQEGVTRRTVVNVPAASTIQIDSIFGGAYGKYILPPCDVYETQVNYKNTSEDAQVKGAIFGGNNNERRSLFTHVNISSTVWQDKAKGYTGTVYGAGRGIDTWSEYTEVNLLDGARVYEAYGGGEMGHVLNSASVQAYMNLYKDGPSQQVGEQDEYWKKHKNELTSENADVKNAALNRWHNDWIAAWKIDGYYNPNGTWTDYANNAATNLSRVSERAELDDKTAAQLDGAKKHNTNVIVNQGAVVDGYIYGGGLGDAKVALTGDVYGTTYAVVLGGEVKKDVYAGGRAGGVDNLFGADDFADPGNAFTATANAYVQGGTARNVYGGGYEGHVGHHEGGINTSYDGDRPAESYVVIGKTGNNTFKGGAPAITRNVYGGGEGGSVYGTSHVTLNNGYIGYRYKNTGTESSPKYEYVEELDDQTANDIELAGNVFGGGYVVNSYVDNTQVNLYGGIVRGSVFGGGEIGPIGRGTVKYKDAYNTGLVNSNARIFKAGQTHVNMYNGHVMRNVYGGGRGKDSWGGDGTMYMKPDVVAKLDLKVKGYVFGQTDVNIYGGEIGSDEGLASGFGNVFGGGDEGFVYSAYEQDITYTQAECDTYNSDNRLTEGMEGFRTTKDVKKSGELFIGNKVGKRYDKGQEGYYYRYNGSAYVDETGNTLGSDAQKFLTEDCHVLVEPWLQVKAPINYDGHTYNTGDYIPTSYLNTLPKKDKDATAWPAAWNYVDAGSVVNNKYVERGVIIHNAVFAGGNIAIGGELYANTTTVFGNATATIHDVYNRDLITVGGIHIGGLYGDGNLTFVDGYRELNVTNYGTDYYNIKEEISNEVYKTLPPREQAYYELKYKLNEGKTVQDNEGTTYTAGSTLPEDEILVLFEGTDKIGTDGKPSPVYWTENGVVSRYAGRYLNTIQRADFCGIFGSRTVMKGARDRVLEVDDGTNYTINRVREVSLNKKASIAGDVGEFATHGNYFGIYSVVNYLGALTSDVNFYNAVRTTDNKDKTKYEAVAKIDDDHQYAYGTATYAQWKEAFYKDPRRNNGLSHNEVALASGVHLELTTEESKGNTLDTKEWGIITGVVQLDLINVAKGVGGGFVYAKNIHGVRNETGKTQTLLTKMNLKDEEGHSNERAVTNRVWRYVETDDASPNKTQKEWQTSGNFVHNTQVIIDDCYNISNRYLMGNRVPAHYWYIRGSVYVYDQYITAQAGSANAYSKNVELPITISAASHNQMKLLDVQPNLYAYYSSYSSGSGTKLGSEQKLLIQDNEYSLNTPISYWDWYLLPASERNLFVKETYVTSDKCKIGDKIYPAGMVMLPSDYNSYETAATTQVIDGKSVKAVIKVVQDEKGNDVVATDKNGNPVYVPFTSVFHSSNEMSHGKGYLLTYKMTNPELWDTWYTQAASTAHAKAQNKANVDGWDNGPTYYLNTTTTDGMLLGQHEYKETDIIPYSVYKSYDDIDDEYIPNNGKSEGDPGYDASKKQAEFEEAYVVTADCSDAKRHYYKGAPVSKTVGTSTGVSASPAYVCTATIQLSETEYIFINDLMTESEKTTLYNSYHNSGTSPEDIKKEQIAKEIKELIVPAYYCTSAGLYGGNYYEAGKNYRALEAWSSMSESDRANFTFNYDAFDLLIDPTYGRAEGQKYQYDGQNFTTPAQAKTNPAQYSLETPIDYTATREGSDLELLTGQKVMVTRNGVKNTEVTGPNSILVDDVIERDEFETKLLNEQYHYAPIDVNSENKDKPFYVVNTAFYYKEPFAAGQVIDAETYSALPDSYKSSGQALVDVLDFSSTTTTPAIYYYCRDSYTIDNTNGTVVVDINSVSHDKNSAVAVGTVLNSAEYEKLKNQQLGFTINGVSPTETSTLYVSRDAKFDDLSTEKIITVIYQYDYEESDESGAHITPISERHVVRIHVTFEDGVPTVEDIREPKIVLPGHSIQMPVPGVNSNGYEIIGGGWELYETEEDAESHFSGKEYTPGSEPLYWYQDDFYIAYYAKTYNRGKTYSNSVPVHVANYHDLKEVMDDKTYHLHVDYDRTQLKRDSKIYINDYSESSQNGLDLFKDFYDLSIGTTLEGHNPLNINTAEGKNKYDDQTYQRGVKGGKNLEFFLHTDIDHSGSAWTPIGSEDDPSTTEVNEEQCFEGDLHGDGHTISGLNKSLFKNLCGSVYNLGVMGSFNSAGVVDKGTGYVESVWVKTTAKTPASSKPNAVFGDPSDNNGYQLVNSYFWNGNKGLYANIAGDDTDVPDYKETITSGGARGVATAKSDTAFYNGELAYDLNNFYLYKRYNDGVSTASGADYKYWKSGETEPQTGYYTDHPELCSSGYKYKEDGSAKYYIRYVEDRFADGDFRYVGDNEGVIPDPDTKDERHWVETVTLENTTTNVDRWSPIWPDDYIFFGQKLTYGWGSQAHQNVPTAVARFEGRLSQDDNANRVYRAPAYYRSKEMGVVHFNPTVYLAQQEKLTDQQIEANEAQVAAGHPEKVIAPREVYPGMTAIDFAGHYDTDYILRQAYRDGLNWTSTQSATQKAFYPPLLDDDGLLSIQNCDETQNLLVYAPSSDDNAQTLGVLNSYFTEPVFDTYYDNSEGYHLVSEALAGSVHGHLVQGGLTASNDHLLVDKQDFNCPIGYQYQMVTSDQGYRMWYQRKPVVEEFNPVKAGTTLTEGKRYYTSDRGNGGFVASAGLVANGTNYYELTTNYVGYKDPDGNYIASSAGWDAISLPFKAEIVTTNDKGEITHFYNKISNDNDNHNFGHEYWLRDYRGGRISSSNNKVFEATFKYPNALETDVNKDYTNTFLWDYYYSHNNLKRADDNTTGEDMNDDEYQEDDYNRDYYKRAHTYKKYPRLAAAMPYIIGFPGERYYEFDLSGKFKAETAKATYPAKLDAQTITFASKLGAAIDVSDDEIALAISTNKSDGYAFKPSYMNESLAAGTNNYTLNADGSSFDKVPASGDATAVSAFRPYFIEAPSPSRAVEQIVFGNEQTEEQKGVEEEHGDPTAEELNGGLRIWSKKDKIYVESSLSFTEDMRVVTPAGITVATFSVKPGKTVEVQADFSGMYIVHTLDGKYTKKVTVKK